MPRFHLVPRPVPPPDISSVAQLADAAYAFHRGLPGYAPTPVHRLDGLASSLGVSSILLKDESHRLGLNAFKVLGPSFAAHRWLAGHPDRGGVTFTTATDGNHGRAVAWTARTTGHRAVIFMPAESAAARITAIEREGAEVVLVAEGYDAAVERARAAADAHDWVLMQDSARPGYLEIPEWISAGYWTMARELEPSPHGSERADADLVLLHAGVGTWPAAMVAYYWHRYGQRRPKIAVIEPTEADCVLASVLAGHPAHATGSLHTIMAGLNCGFPSTAAFDILANSVDAFFTVPDRWAEHAVRRLAEPSNGDPAVVAGESGAASIAGLMALVEDPELEAVRNHLAVGRRIRVLTWCTEGATDPVNWRRVTGREP
jgi:diaminopropionate ammonia-lyase